MHTIAELTIVIQEDLAGQHVCTFQIPAGKIRMDAAQIAASALVHRVASACNEGWEAGIAAILADAERMRK